jgi:predicted AlkP superfamily pyrophosphatase or phosphodiesterase
MTAESRTNGTVDRIIVLDVVGLRPDHLDAGLAPNVAELLDDRVASLRPPFPAVTIPVQTTLATGQSPATHGDVANGEYDRDRDEVAFWERDVEDRYRVWEAASEEAGLTTGVLFFQHLIGTTADVAVTPSPIEDEDNNMLEMNCWTNPDGFYDDLEAEYGHFPLHNYWGPMAGAESSEWILTAARESIERYDPDLLWVYVPHLDYDAQRHGPDAAEALDAVEVIDGLLGEFLDWLRSGERWSETAVNIVGEYGFQPVDTPVFPNRVLREAGLLEVTTDREGGEEVDLGASEAFAMVDHQVAHVYTEAVEAARTALSSLGGVDAVIDRSETNEYGIDHPNTGELVLVAEPDAWFQYYWWTDREDAPHYATDMDIHSKPGFDPCELFIGETGLASLDPTKVGGSHGRVEKAGFGFYGLGGPAAPEGLPDASTDEVDARAVAPTVADLLGIADELSLPFERPSLLER